MKRIITLVLFFCLMLGSVMAQKEPALIPQVFRSTYHDVSPPLRDLINNPPGPADNSWKDGIIRNNIRPFGYPSEEGAITPDHTVQNYNGSRQPDSVLLSFDGVGSICNCLPPDTDGDVGLSHYFQTVNLSYAIYDKSGNKLLGPFTNSSIWNGMPHNSNDGDAVVLYDEVNDRWVMSQFSLPNYPSGPYYEMIAVSQTNDPTGSWYRYEFSYTNMGDYPKLGIWMDGIYMTQNMFANASNYVGTGYCAFEKDAMYSGASSAQMVMFTLPSGDPWCVLPSDCDGAYPPAGTPCFFGYQHSNHIRIYGFHVDWTTPANSTYTELVELPVTSYTAWSSGSMIIPQPGTTVKLDPLSDRGLMHRLSFRKFNDHWSMISNSTINVSGVAAIRWYELRNDMTNPANWTIYQQGTYNPDNSFRWSGSMAMDSLGNIALGYSLSSSTIYPSVVYTGRLASDPLNTMTITETPIKVGGGSQTYVYSGRARWGDYTAMSADPSQPSKFWYTNEYYSTTSSMSWKTRIGSFSFGNILMATASSVPNLVCTGDSTQLGVTVSGGSGTYTYSWTSNPAGFTSTLQNPVAHPAASTTYIISVNDGTNTVVDSTHVTVQAPPTAFAGNDSIFCNYLSVITVHGSGTGYDQNSWVTLGDGFFDNPQAMVTTYHPMTNDKNNGVYLILMVHAALPCHGLVNDTVFYQFQTCTGISDPLSTDLSISVLPNPSNGIINLNIANLGNQIADVVVTDIQGHSVYHHVYQAAGNILKDQIDISYLPKGAYIMKVKTDTRNQIEKIILQ
jgi:hypothetical protein